MKNNIFCIFLVITIIALGLFKSSIAIASINKNYHKNLIIFLHGTNNSLKENNCFNWNRQVPNSLKELQKIPNTDFAYLCSKSTGRNYYDKRQVELEATLDGYIAKGYDPRRIILSGQSAGSWVVLKSMHLQGKKFNTAVLFAPACCSKREFQNLNKKMLERNHIQQMLEADSMEALIFSYDDDPYLRPIDIKFLQTNYGKDINIISSNCGKGHFTSTNDCNYNNTKSLIYNYVIKRLPKNN